MVLLFKLIIITVIIVLGLKVVLSEKMLLEKLGEYFEKKVDDGHKIYNIFVCPFCMCSLQSVTAHLFAFGLGILPFEFNWQLLLRWILVLLGSSFIAGNIWGLYETINRIREKNEWETFHYENLNSKEKK